MLVDLELSHPLRRHQSELQRKHFVVRSIKARNIRDDDSRVRDSSIYDELRTIPERQPLSRVDNEEDREHLNGNNDTLDRTGFLCLDEMIVILLYKSLLRSERMSNTNRTDDFFGQCSSLSVMVQGSFFVFLHDCGGDDDGKNESGDDADEYESHFPLFDESDDEGDEEHCDGVDCQGYFF